MYDLLNSKLDLSDVILKARQALSSYRAVPAWWNCDLDEQEFDRILCTMSALDNFAISYW